MNKPIYVVGLAACLVLCGACTWRGSYESIRQTARNECQREVSDDERRRCLERLQDDFDEYTRKREAVKDAREDVQGAPTADSVADRAS